jgi:uncharacterized membrane protein
MVFKKHGLASGRALTGLAILLLLALALTVTGNSLAAEETKKPLPPRAISVAPEYTSVVLTKGEDVSLDLTVANGGQSDEEILLSISPLPKGWKAYVKTYSFEIKGVHVKSDKSKSLTFRIEPPEGVREGDYTVGILGVTKDKAITSSSQVTITVKAAKEKEKPKGLNIITSYPVLRGATDSKFEFSLEVENKLGKDMIYNLVAQGPENWTINFKPAYEDKYISSVRLKENQSQTVAVEVKPYPWSQPGEYPIAVRVSSPEAKGEATLTVLLTGTYKLDAGTSSGILSLSATRGNQSSVSLFVKNSGSAILQNVQFLSFKPENWEVQFKPERIESLAPDELKQVEVVVTPAGQALVGDYSVGVNVQAGNPARAEKTIELRVMVKASTAWSWAGIGIILFVLAGLVVLFVRLGRR